MKKNIGQLDKFLRIGISFFLIYIGFIDALFIGDALSSNVVGIIGILNLLVATLGFCPLYAFTGISTYQKKTK